MSSNNLPRPVPTDPHANPLGCITYTAPNLCRQPHYGDFLPKLGSAGQYDLQLLSAHENPHPNSVRFQQNTVNRTRHWPGRVKGGHIPNDTDSLPGRCGATTSTNRHSWLQDPVRGRGTGASAARTPDHPGGVCGQRPASEAASRAPSAAAPPPARTRQPLGHAGAAAAEQGIERHLPPGPYERAPMGIRERGGAPVHARA